jgi:hypothetical protein
MDVQTGLALYWWQSLLNSASSNLYDIDWDETASIEYTTKKYVYMILMVWKRAV